MKGLIKTKPRTSLIIRTVACEPVRLLSDVRGLVLRTFDPAFCAHFWTDLLFPKVCIIFHFFW